MHFEAESQPGFERLFAPDRLSSWSLSADCFLRSVDSQQWVELDSTAPGRVGSSVAVGKLAVAVASSEAGSYMRCRSG